MKHEFLIGADFLNTVQITINEGVIINALNPIPEDKEVHEMCQLDSDEINNIDVTHVLNTEYSRHN
jgi:hypothetical protein